MIAGSASVKDSDEGGSGSKGFRSPAGEAHKQTAPYRRPNGRCGRPAPALLGVAVLAGIAGALLGVGGGIFLVPFITLGLGIDQKVATAVSIVGVIATSSGAASVYVRDRMVNLRLGMWLEIATTIGGVLGALLAVYASSSALAFIFAAGSMFVAVSMVRRTEVAAPAGPERPTGLAAKLRLDNEYSDSEGVRTYHVDRPVAGLAASAIAGTASGILGVGGGFIKVPVMNLMMKVPIRAAIATSNLMIGVTAAASAFVYYFSGYLDPAMAGVVVVGVAGGTVLGTRLMKATPRRQIRVGFAVFLGFVGVLMALKGLGVIGVI